MIIVAATSERMQWRMGSTRGKENQWGEEKTRFPNNIITFLGITTPAEKHSIGL